MSFVAVLVLHANAGGGLSTYGWAVVLAFVCVCHLELLAVWSKLVNSV